jgi:CheY-like chemotaxis protein
MLVFSRKQVLSPLVLDLNAVVNETAKMLKRLIGEDIELRVSLAEPLWATRADPDQIVQVLMNLCVNARDAMPQGGKLTLVTSNVTVGEAGLENRAYVAPGDYVRLSVADTGTGISKDVQEQMFEPFFTTKDIGKGTGLGLSTVYGIVKQSGGFIWADSELGRGACFTIYLPREKGVVAPVLPAQTEQRQRGTETLLVVEDEEPLRDSIRDFMGSLGYTVLTADSGQQALVMASEHAGPIDLLVTDVVMPRMSGRELSQTLVHLRPNLKTIFMSGYTDDNVVRHGVGEASIAFLQKPFSLSTLARKVRDMIGSAETRQ